MRLLVNQGAPHLGAAGRDQTDTFRQRGALAHRDAALDRQRGPRQRAEGALQRAHRVRSQPIVLADALALLGEMQHAVDRFGRRGTQQCIDAAATARNAATAAIEQHVLFVRLAQRVGQVALRAVGRQARGDHAALLVAVGEADQHGLQPPTGFEMTFVHPILKQLAHHRAAALQRFHPVELRRHVERHLALALVVGAGPACQHQWREHVVGLRYAADDVQSDRIGTIAVAALGDGIEHRQRALGERIEAAGGTDVALQDLHQSRVPIGGAASHPLGIIHALCQHRVMHRGVCAHIERCQVKPEGIDTVQQAPHLEISGVGAAVGEQALRYQRNVGAKLRRLLVAVGAPVVGDVQPLGDLPEQYAIRHAVVARWGDGLGTGQQRAVFLHPAHDCARDADAARAL